MSFFRIIIILSFIFLANKSFADESTEKQKVLDQTKEIVKQLENDDEVPLNDPFAGNEGTNSMTNIPEGEAEDEMSLYNFKLVGIISGEYEAFVSLVNTSGEVITVGLHEELSEGVRLIDMRLTEAIFQNGEKYMVIDFNNQITEKDEY